jgi:hypothetical protein
MNATTKLLGFYDYIIDKILVDHKVTLTSITEDLLIRTAYETFHNELSTNDIVERLKSRITISNSGYQTPEQEEVRHGADTNINNTPVESLGNQEQNSPRSERSGIIDISSSDGTDSVPTSQSVLPLQHSSHLPDQTVIIRPDADVDQTTSLSSNESPESVSVHTAIVHPTVPEVSEPMEDKWTESFPLEIEISVDPDYTGNNDENNAANSSSVHLEPSSSIFLSQMANRNDSQNIEGDPMCSSQGLKANATISSESITQAERPKQKKRKEPPHSEQPVKMDHPYQTRKIWVKPLQDWTNHCEQLEKYYLEKKHYRVPMDFEVTVNIDGNKETLMLGLWLLQEKEILESYKFVNAKRYDLLRKVFDSDPYFFSAVESTIPSSSRAVSSEMGDKQDFPSGKKKRGRPPKAIQFKEGETDFAISNPSPPDSAATEPLSKL